MGWLRTQSPGITLSYQKLDLSCMGNHPDMHAPVQGIFYWSSRKLLVQLVQENEGRKGACPVEGIKAREVFQSKGRDENPSDSLWTVTEARDYEK